MVLVKISPCGHPQSCNESAETAVPVQQKEASLHWKKPYGYERKYRNPPYSTALFHIGATVFPYLQPVMVTWDCLILKTADIYASQMKSAQTVLHQRITSETYVYHIATLRKIKIGLFEMSRLTTAFNLQISRSRPAGLSQAETACCPI